MRSINLQLLIGASFLVWVVASTQGQENYEMEWAYKATLTLNTSNSGADILGSVQNIPILVRLNNSNFVFASAQANGEDLRFVKNGVSLSYEIEHWDASGEEASVWVLMDEVLGNNSSQSVSMYWGNEEASTQSNGSAVFDTSNGFTGAWHFNEDPNGDVSDVMKDRTGTEQHLTPYGSMTSANSVAGVVGKAIDFDGVDDYLDLGTVTTDFTQGVSICAWVNYDTFYRWTRIADFGIGTSKHNIVFANYITTNTLAFEVFPDTVYANRSYLFVDSVLTINSWDYVCGVLDGASRVSKIYHNGVQIGMDSAWSLPAIVNRTASYIAKSNWDIDGYLDGQIDEVRVSKVARSGDWVKLSYESQKLGSTWIQTGNTQSVGIDSYAVTSNKPNHFVHNGFSQLVVPVETKQIELYSTQGERVLVVTPNGKKRLSVPSSLDKGLYHVKYVQ